MNVDRVDFQQEPFDCAVLLSDGQFPGDWHSVRLFEEWLIPVCAPSAVAAGPWDLARLRAAQQLHPTPDRRDWRRWLAAMQLEEQVPLQSGQLFDMLELGIVAAARGYGVSIGDLLLVAEDVAAGRLGLPWPEAVASGDSYYLVWPRARRGQQRFSQLAAFLQAEVASLPLPAVGYRR
jgi:DNA-binding transcriptional LysR family regulator